MTSFPAASQIATGIFVLCLLTTVVGALIAVMSTRLIRSVSGLAIACVGLAGLYYFLHSPFLAMMEILIYVGAVCVTIVFAIMLSDPDEPQPEKGSRSRLAWAGMGMVVAGAIFWGLCRIGLKTAWPEAGARTADGSVKALGISLLTTYSMAFELISLALLVAILGALAIAKTGRAKEE